jgi:hypothetical protein
MTTTSDDRRVVVGRVYLRPSVFDAFRRCGVDAHENSWVNDHDG